MYGLQDSIEKSQFSLLGGPDILLCFFYMFFEGAAYKNTCSHFWLIDKSEVKLINIVQSHAMLEELLDYVSPFTPVLLLYCSLDNYLNAVYGKYKTIGVDMQFNCE